MKVDNHGKIENWDPSRKLCEHFTLKELANNQGNPAIPQYILDTRVERFLSMLEEFRQWFNKPMNINGSYRQPAFNAKTKGADPASAHTHACAVDWGISGHSDVQRNNVKLKWHELCKKYGTIGAVNFYTNGYHLEAYSDIWYGSTSNQVRDYRKTPSDW